MESLILWHSITFLSVARKVIEKIEVCFPHIFFRKRCIWKTEICKYTKHYIG